MKKHLFWAVLAVFCLTSCNFGPTDPIQAEMEEYAKQHMEVFAPETYEFGNMGVANPHRYYEELEMYKAGLEKRYDKDPEFCEKEYKRIKALEDAHGVEVACTEYVLHYWAKTEHGTKIPLMVFAIYDNEGNQLWIGSKREDLPAYPALNMLRNNGEL